MDENNNYQEIENEQGESSDYQETENEQGESSSYQETENEQAGSFEYQADNNGQEPYYGPEVVDDGKNMSIAALILGILGIIGGWIPVVCYFTFVCAILGIIFGVKGRAKSTEAYGKPSGLATAGLVLGIIGAAFGVLGLICTGICAAAACTASL